MFGPHRPGTHSQSALTYVCGMSTYHCHDSTSIFICIIVCGTAFNMLCVAVIVKLYIQRGEAVFPQVVAAAQRSVSAYSSNSTSFILLRNDVTRVE
jgi:hypothetical protein